MSDGVLRDASLVDNQQAQTSDAFGFKWHQRDTYSVDNPSIRKLHHDWTVARFGGREIASYFPAGKHPIVLDAGCGSGLAALVNFSGMFDDIRYVGLDISRAVDIAAETIGAASSQNLFIQADMTKAPIANEAVDFIMAEGTLHHTPSTRGALASLVPKLRRGGKIAFYVYAKKSAIREFTDDYVREQFSHLSPEKAWEATEDITRLGIALGKIDAEIELDAPVRALGIPAGKWPVQRFFYWHVLKAFVRPDLSFADMNHINFDWFAPAYAHRQTPDEVRQWCGELGLEIEHFHVEEAGITVVAKRS
ncbi:MAG: class I SAM-dependent methyltransferase [Proteobacteria bacterium]|nr:class I SAM-dependent methyltransferase [Pseudomonadota bacterium]